MNDLNDALKALERIKEVISAAVTNNLEQLSLGIITSTQQRVKHRELEFMLHDYDVIKQVLDRMIETPPQGWKLVPIEVVNLYDFMLITFVPMTPQQDQIRIYLNKAKNAMKAAPTPSTTDEGTLDQLGVVSRAFEKLEKIKAENEEMKAKLDKAAKWQQIKNAPMDRPFIGYSQTLGVRNNVYWNTNSIFSKKFPETEVIGYFEFMGKKICNVTKDNFEAVQILIEATKSMLSPSSKQECDISHDRRVTELLEANNVQVQLRRDAQAEVKSLKNALYDVLKAIIIPDNGVTDTIWISDCCPIGDFIMGFLDEDIDLDELQNAPYRCKQTYEMFPPPIIDGLEEAINNLRIAQSKGLVHPVETSSEGKIFYKAAQAYFKIQKEKS